MWWASRGLLLPYVTCAVYPSARAARITSPGFDQSMPTHQYGNGSPIGPGYATPSLRRSWVEQPGGLAGLNPGRP
jgi:hypothetical protein